MSYSPQTSKAETYTLVLGECRTLRSRPIAPLSVKYPTPLNKCAQTVVKRTRRWIYVHDTNEEAYKTEQRIVNVPAWTSLVFSKKMRYTEQHANTAKRTRLCRIVGRMSVPETLVSGIYGNGGRNTNGLWN